MEAVDSAGAVAPDGASPVSASSYEVMVPAGWIRIPVADAGDDSTLEDLIRASLQDWPEHEARGAREELLATIRGGVAEARAAGVIDFFVPIAPVGEVVLSCSVAISAMTLPDESANPFDVMLWMAANDKTARAMDIAGSVALRRQSRTPRDASDNASASSIVGQIKQLIVADHTVSYLIGVPDDRERWLTMTLNALEFEGSADLVEAIVELFDAFAGSFRWCD